MKRSSLKNKYIKVKIEAPLNAYTMHRNFCKNLVLKSKMKYYKNQKPCSLIDRRKFWKVFIRLFLDKVIKKDITLLESDKIINGPTDIANEFSSLFSSAVSISEIKDLYYVTINLSDDLVLRAIHKFKNHPGIIRLGEMYPSPQCFSFKYFTSEDIFKAIYL